MTASVVATGSPTTSTSVLPYASPTRETSGPRTLFLDGMRGLAAMYVLMRHVTWMPPADVSGPTWRRFLSVLEHTFRYGHLAVIFFFVLSGFVIHLRYAKNLQNDPLGATFNWADFVYRRMRRLYPPLLAAILVTSVFDFACSRMGFDQFYAMRGREFDFLPVAIDYNHELKTFMGNFAFLMQMHVPVWGTDSPLWSLAYEWWFYMLYPLLWRLSRRSIWLATGCVLAGFLLTHIRGDWPGIQAGSYPFEGWHMLSLPRRVLGALPAWWCGVLLADVYAGRIKASFKWLSWLSIALGFMFIHDLPEVVKAMIAGLGFCGMIALGFHLQERGARLTLLNRLKFLGDFSYSLYVTHWPVVIFLTPFWALYVAGKFPGSLPLGLVMITLVPIAIAYLVHLVAEKPFTRSHKPKPPIAQPI